MPNTRHATPPVPNRLEAFIDSGASPLTPREISVLALIVQGATSKEVGTTLGVSRRTIEFHRANIMQKLSAQNVADLIRILSSEYFTRAVRKTALALYIDRGLSSVIDLVAEHI